MKDLKKYNQSGFTLLELIIVIIVLAILVGLAVVQFSSTTERSKAAEALNIIQAINDAQMRYAAANNNTTVGGACANLDITIPTQLQFFSAPACTGAALTSALKTVSMQRSNALSPLPSGWGATGYTVTMCGSGRMICADGTFAGGCQSLGLGASAPTCP